MLFLRIHLKVLVVLGSLVLPALAAADLQPFAAHYTLKTDGVTIGVRSLTLTESEPEVFVFESEIRTAGLGAWFKDGRITERSEWQYHTGTIRPLRYRYVHSGDNRNRLVTIDFDWERGKATNTVDSSSWRMQIPSGTQDKLVYLLSLMRHLQRGLTRVSYPIADGGTLKTYDLRVIAETELDTPLGRLSTLKLTRQTSPPRREMFIWCARELNYLPVRISRRDSRGDHELEMLIESVRGLPLLGDE